MRVTELQTFSLLAGNLQRMRSRSLMLQRQVSTGKQVTQPSDDPTSFNYIARDKASLAAVEQRLRNITLGQTRLDLSDRILSNTTGSLSRVQQLAVQFRSDTNGQAARLIGAQEVRQLLGQMQQSANTALNGQPIFSGTSTHGRTTGLAMTVPATLISGANDTLLVTVDGITSGTIDLTSGTESFTGVELAARVQSRINADTALAGSGKTVTVTFDADHLVIASDSHGAESTVTISGGLARASLGLAGGSATTGEVPFALTASVSPAAGNTGGAIAGQARVVDDNLATLDDYMIRFSSATTYEVLDVTVPVTTARGANTGGAAIASASVADASGLTLHDYQIQFTSSTQFSVLDTTAGTTVSSGNAYVPGGSITFDGIQVAIANGAQGGPQSGDTFSVSLTPRTVLAGQAYATGQDIGFDGIRLSLSDGGGPPAGGDLYAVVLGVQYQGDAGVHAIEVGPGQTVATNVSGDRAFMSGTVDIFGSVKQLLGALRGNHGGGISEALGTLDRGLSQIGAIQGEVGALSNRLTNRADQLDDLKGFFAVTLSQTEDVDLAKAISDLTLQQYAIEAASQTLTKVFESSLLRYL